MPIFETLEPRLLLNGAPGNLVGHLARLAESFSPESITAITDPADGKTGLGVGGTSSLLSFTDDGCVLVDVWAIESVGEIATELADLGFDVLSLSEDYRLLEGAMPIESLWDAAALDGVLSITPVYQPFTRRGDVQTQGDEVINADDVRALGYDGSPFLIGALSDSALDIADSQATDDLPAVVDRYLEFPVDDEGRAMLEIISDIAPEANLAHHSGIFGELSFAEGIEELAAAGSRIIVDDIGYPSEPFFQDGIIAQAIEDVISEYDVIYVSAAGNEGDLSYEADFADSSGAGPASGLHDFDPGPGIDVFQQITLPVVPSNHYRDMTIVLQWDQPFYTPAGVTSNFDIHLYADDGTTVIASATDDNLATQQPIEVFQWEHESTSFLPFVLMRLNDPAIQKKKELMTRRLVSRTIGNVLLATLLPAISRAVVLRDRVTAQGDVSVVAMALATYRAEKKAYPDKLSQLSPTYLKKLPDDLFVDKPFGYKRTDKGYLLYSVGENMKFDGEKEEEKKKDDIVVRVE